MKIEKLVVIIEANEDYDRYIKYSVLNGEVVNIDFLQGCYDDTFHDLVKMDRTNENLLEIFNTINNYHKLIVMMDNQAIQPPLNEIINNAIELYCDKYVYKFIH
jgi:hypothetical protein